MGNRDNLMLGRVKGAITLCQDISENPINSFLTRWYARKAIAALTSMLNRLDRRINGGI